MLFVHILQGASTGFAKVELSGSSFFFVPLNVFNDLAIEPNRELNDLQLDTLKFYNGVYFAFQKCLELLSYRAHTRFQLKTKLHKKDFEYEHIESALDFLQKKGYLNDQEWAEAWIESRLKRHPEGKSALTAGLLKGGVSRNIIEKVLCEKLTDVKLNDALNSAAEKLMKKTDISSVKLKRSLMKRGFPRSLIENWIFSNTDFDKNTDNYFDRH
jgi:regulatory protein